MSQWSNNHYLVIVFLVVERVGIMFNADGSNIVFIFSGVGNNCDVGDMTFSIYNILSLIKKSLEDPGAVT